LNKEVVDETTVLEFEFLRTLLKRTFAYVDISLTGCYPVSSYRPSRRFIYL